MTGINWLHLSDWHQKGADFDRDVVRDALIKDIRERTKRINSSLGQIDFIVFSGDVTQNGLSDEYTASKKNLFDLVVEATGTSPDRLFFVPGNHDLDWDAFKSLSPELLKPLESNDQVNSWLTDDKKRAQLLEPFKAYNQFVSNYTDQPNPNFASFRHWEIGDRQLAILGLNSAWMCGRNKDKTGEVNDKGFLLVGEPQIHSSLEQMADVDIKIVVLHHPLDWLAEFDCIRVEDRLQRECHFILHGHIHRPQVKVIKGTSGNCVIIPAGTSYDRRIPEDPHYTNSYNFVHFDRETNQGIVYLRRWSETRNEWIEDIDAHPGGKYKFSLPNKTISPTPSPIPIGPAMPTDNLPHPIACVCAECNSAPSNEQRFIAADRLLNNIVKYLTAIALSQYWQDNPDKKQLHSWLKQLEESRLLSSLYILDCVTEHYTVAKDKPTLYQQLFQPYRDLAVDEETPIASAYRAIAKYHTGQKAQVLNLTSQLFLQRLLALRENKWESSPGEIDPPLRNALLLPLWSALGQLLEIFQSLWQLPLLYIERRDPDGKDWVYTLITFPGLQGSPHVFKPPFRECDATNPTYSALCLYLCTPDGKPLINLHPFLIAHLEEGLYKLYFLERGEKKPEIWYRHCASPERYQPPEYYRFLSSNWIKSQAEIEKEDDPVSQCQRARAELEKFESETRFDTMSLNILLIHLSIEARNALEIGLGEALRIGQFWLGVEFLLMGMSKQEESALTKKLNEIIVKGRDLRGIYRVLAGVRNEDFRKKSNAAKIGAEALPLLQDINPTQLAVIYGTVEMPMAVITPRMMVVLRQAALMAGEGKISTTHLLSAAIRHPQCVAINSLLGMMAKSGHDPRKWIQQFSKDAGIATENRVEPQKGTLELEILSGPRDGQIVSLDTETEWTSISDGALSFPWDDELGKPQALFAMDEHIWRLQAFKSPHGTYRLNTEERITNGYLQLSEGDILKARNTWLLVRNK